MSEEKELILVCGVDGSGRSTFASCFKNSFLKSFSRMPLYYGLLGGMSFCASSSLIADEDLSYIQKAHQEGYKITVYYLFCGKILALARNRFRVLSEGITFDEASFKKSYDLSYKGLFSIYEYCSAVFLVRNQKEFDFMAAYSIKETKKEDFENVVKKTKIMVDRLR